MFIVTLTYDAPVEEIDKALEAHIAWLDKHYADGTFVASGRRVPRTGGVILAQAVNEDALKAVLAGDPFAKGKLARYDVSQFVASKARSGLEALIGL